MLISTTVCFTKWDEISTIGKCSRWFVLQGNPFQWYSFNKSGTLEFHLLPWNLIKLSYATNIYDWVQVIHKICVDDWFLLLPISLRAQTRDINFRWISHKMTRLVYKKCRCENTRIRNEGCLIYKKNLYRKNYNN